jgi:hypothetical protein
VHLILVWEERDDPNLLRHAQRAKEVGRNPHVVGVPRRARAERLVLRLGGRRPAGARNQSRVIDAAWGTVLTLGVEEELMLVDAETLSQRRRRAR